MSWILNKLQSYSQFYGTTGAVFGSYFSIQNVAVILASSYESCPASGNYNGSVQSCIVDVPTGSTTVTLDIWGTGGGNTVGGGFLRAIRIA